MTEDLLDYWLRLIKPVFPAHAWIVARFSDGGQWIEIDWKLEDDPSQPNKRSRKIQIIISEKVIDDYLAKNKEGRELSDTRLKHWIHARHEHFRLDHAAGASRTTATEKWLIPIDALNA